MNAKGQAKLWLKKLVSVVTIILLALMAAAYAVDPYLYYRINDNKYMLNSRFVTKGLIENYEYDTVIVGSSMVRNFNMQSFRDKLDYEPVKATMGAMTIAEIELMHQLAMDQEKTERIITNLDMVSFNANEEDNRFPMYLYDDNRLNDFKYLLGYETWMRFIPVDLGINTLYKAGVDLPDKFDRKTSIDLLEDSSAESTYSREQVLETYFNPDLGLSKQDPAEMYQRMTNRFDKFLENIEMQQTLDYVFLFPPYSALYWYEAEDRGYRTELVEFKKYVIESLEDYSNVRIVDMQDLDLITDLDHYMDLTHFDPEIQEMIVDAIGSGDFDVTVESMDTKIKRLNELVERFKKENPEIIQ